MPSKTERAVAMEMIEEISADAQSTNPKRDWKESQEAVCKIYKLAHSVRAPGCRKNHPSWYEPIKKSVKSPGGGK